MLEKTKQQKNQTSSKEGTRIRNPILYTFRSLIKVLYGKLDYICRKPGAGQCRPIAYCFHLYEFI